MTTCIIRCCELCLHKFPDVGQSHCRWMQLMILEVFHNVLVHFSAKSSHSQESDNGWLYCMITQREKTSAHIIHCKYLAVVVVKICEHMLDNRCRMTSMQWLKLVSNTLHPKTNDWGKLTYVSQFLALSTCSKSANRIHVRLQEQKKNCDRQMFKAA